MIRAIVLCLLIYRNLVAGRNVFNQTAGYEVQVNFETWSNFGEFGGCVSCPYTCVKPLEGPNGVALNYSNATAMAAIPAAFLTTQQNGCCFAAASKTTQAPDCNTPANPVDAEDCGYTYGPTLEWDITTTFPQEDPTSAMLFASIDCESFWAIGMEYVKHDLDQDAGEITGKKQINGGCYGDPAGQPIVMAGCLSTTLKFDKSKTYTWEMLAEKCLGLSGQCSRTNGLWGRNLKCCTDAFAIQGSAWDLTYPLYHEEASTGTVLSGAAIFGIVFGGVAILMCMVHYGAKIKERARQTALMREQEATDDYDEIITPLTTNADLTKINIAPLRVPAAGDLGVSLVEGDDIYRPPENEVLYEGDMY